MWHCAVVCRNLILYLILSPLKKTATPYAGVEDPDRANEGFRLWLALQMRFSEKQKAEISCDE